MFFFWGGGLKPSLGGFFGGGGGGGLKPSLGGFLGGGGGGVEEFLEHTNRQIANYILSYIQYMYM